MESVTRYFDLPRGNFFLFGPRGTGKSTLLAKALPEALLIDLLKPDVYRAYKATPERIIERVEAEPDRMDVVVDEVQRVPELLPAIHHLMERFPERRFVLTGSSARKLKRSGVDLLAGRALLKHLHPFIAGELGDRFSLEQVLKQGTVPLVVMSDTPEETLASYVSLYLREEVQAEGLVRNLGNFSRFLEMAGFSHGSVLNVSNIARDCGVNSKTASSYVEILEDLLLAWRLPVFRRRARRELVSHPKFYFFDCGVFRSLRPAGLLDRPQEMEGPALEGLVGQHLRAWISYRYPEHELFYWRTRAGTEVDFVVYGPDAFVGVEVKNTRRIRPADLRPLRSFHDEYPEAERILLYRGTERLLKQGVLCLPVGSFLQAGKLRCR